MAEQDSNALIVGAGFTIEGDVRGKGTLLLGGTVKGTVSAEVVKLTETGLVYGHIDCVQLDMAGKLNGSFNSTDVIVRPGAMITASTEVVSKGTCLVAGTVNANLKANQLKVEAGGNFIGNVQANELDVHGKVNGVVDAADIIVRNRASIDGTIHYGNLSMERGSDVSGQLQRKQQGSGVSQAATVERISIELPLQMLREKVKNPDAPLVLTTADGAPLPSWISVDAPGSRLQVEKPAFAQLASSGKTLTLRLQLGEESITFVLPPEAR